MAAKFPNQRHCVDTAWVRGWGNGSSPSWTRMVHFSKWGEDKGTWQRTGKIQPSIALQPVGVGTQGRPSMLRFPSLHKTKPMRSNQRTRGNGHDPRYSETPWQTPWPGIHCALISETQDRAGSHLPLSTGPSDFINFVLQVAEQGIQAFGRTPELFEHEAFFLVHIFKHWLQEAPDEAFRLLQHLEGNTRASLAWRQGLCSRRMYLTSSCPKPEEVASSGPGQRPGMDCRHAETLSPQTLGWLSGTRINLNCRSDTDIYSESLSMDVMTKFGKYGFHLPMLPNLRMAGITE